MPGRAKLRPRRPWTQQHDVWSGGMTEAELIEPRRMGPLIRNLRRATDPLFWRAGMDLDGEGRK